MAHGVALSDIHPAVEAGINASLEPEEAAAIAAAMEG
jgi:hypothetical protein